VVGQTVVVDGGEDNRGTRLSDAIYAFRKGGNWEDVDAKGPVASLREKKSTKISLGGEALEEAGNL